MSDQLCTFPVALLAKKRGFQKFKSSENIEGEFFFYNNFGVIDSNYYKKGLGSKLGAMLNDKNVGAKWSNSCEAPTQTELQKWLRETHNMYVTALPYRDNSESDDLLWYYSRVVDEKNNIFCNPEDLEANASDFFESYESALEEGLHEALKFING